MKFGEESGVEMRLRLETSVVGAKESSLPEYRVAAKSHRMRALRLSLQVRLTRDEGNRIGREIQQG